MRYPFSAALRKLYPQAKISWLVHPQFSGFLPDPPIIDEVIYFNKVEFNKMNLFSKINFLRKFRKELHAKKSDLVIDYKDYSKVQSLRHWQDVRIASDIAKWGEVKRTGQ